MSHDVELIADGFRFTECPRWHDGQLYFVDMADDRVCRIGRTGTVEVVLELPHPGGLGWTPDGDMLALSSHARELHCVRDGKAYLAATLDGLGFLILNDMVVDAKGGAYIGGLGEGLFEGRLPPVPIAYVAPDGIVSIVAEGIFGPNGMAVSKDGKTLVVAETFAYRLIAFDIAEDGTLSGKRIFSEGHATPSVTMTDVLANPKMLPDGLAAMDAEGAIWTADARGGGVVRLADGGAELDRITFGDDTVIAAALGGPAGNDLYMLVGPPFAQIPALLQGTERRYSVYRARVPVPVA